ncbi:hypothetical protein HAP94_04520 [Acidithiobacillus ferrivorans]|nr:hypothetical protein [Acidithiobacillus ferrivorans]
MSLQVVSVKLLVDMDALKVAGYSDVNALLSAMIRADYEDTDDSAIIDFEVGTHEIVCTEIEDSIVNDTYVNGEVFRDWVFFAKSEQNYGDHCHSSGYWSEGYGWSNYRLATRYRPFGIRRPRSNTNDAILLMDSPDFCNTHSF